MWVKVRTPCWLLLLPAAPAEVGEAASDDDDNDPLVFVVRTTCDPACCWVDELLPRLNPWENCEEEKGEG
jgi:hypothetical protein